MTMPMTSTPSTARNKMYALLVCISLLDRGAHASRVLVAASRRNHLFDCRSCRKEKFVIARTRSPARETRALPRMRSLRSSSFSRLLRFRFGKDQFLADLQLARVIDVI